MATKHYEFYSTLGAQNGLRNALKLYHIKLGELHRETYDQHIIRPSFDVQDIFSDSRLRMASRIRVGGGAFRHPYEFEITFYLARSVVEKYGKRSDFVAHGMHEAFSSQNIVKSLEEIATEFGGYETRRVDGRDRFVPRTDYYFYAYLTPARHIFGKLNDIIRATRQLIAHRTPGNGWRVYENRENNELFVGVDTRAIRLVDKTAILSPAFESFSSRYRDHGQAALI